MELICSPKNPRQSRRAPSRVQATGAVKERRVILPSRTVSARARPEPRTPDHPRNPHEESRLRPASRRDGPTPSPFAPRTNVRPPACRRPASRYNSPRTARPLGGIGRRDGFKIHFLHWSIGSTPIEATFCTRTGPHSSESFAKTEVSCVAARFGCETVLADSDGCCAGFCTAFVPPPASAFLKCSSVTCR